MRLLALAALAAAAGGAVVFVWLFGSGAVFGQEAAAWPTTKAIVRARILGDDLVKLSADPEKYVATRDGEREYLRLLRGRGITLVDRGGSGMMFRDHGGRRCAGYSYAFTSALVVYHAPEC